MPHHCHATNCTVSVPPEMFMCKKHWFSLPKAMRNRIWETYHPGQCVDWEISHEYAEAARAAVRFIANKEGIEADVSVYDMLDPGQGKEAANWHSEHEEPTAPGWYECEAVDDRWNGGRRYRAWGNGCWWIPLKDGWLSSRMGLYRWRGPVADVNGPAPDGTDPRPTRFDTGVQEELF